LILSCLSHSPSSTSSLRDLNSQSDDEELFSRVQREFKAFDSNECGFLLEDKLPALLTRLSVPFASNTGEVHRFSDFIQLDGGIILWSTFWENISKILTGTSLDSLLDQTSNQAVVVTPSASNNLPVQATQRRRSDSEIARELQANYDRNPFYEDHLPAVATARTPIRTTIVPNRPRSDSEIARQMQDEWNQDDETNPMPSSSVLQPVEESVAVLPTGGTKRHRSDSIATKDDENFVCYHYNGFDIRASANPTSEASTKTQNLTRFKLYRR
jgi:hypothetical protein